MKNFIPILIAVSLAACGRATTFDQFSLEEGSSARMDASQRVVLVSNRGGKHGDRHIVCAEPSPDSIISASAILSANAEYNAGAAAGVTAASGSAAATFASAQNAAFIGMRTQTIQLLRDGLYRACEAYMNGAIDEHEYNLLLINMPKVMTALIAIDGLTARPAAPAVMLASPAITTTKDGTTTVEGGAVLKVGEDGKLVSVTSLGGIVAPPGNAEKLSDNAAAAVYGIAQTIQQSPTMPAVCMSLLNNHGDDQYRSDQSYRLVMDYCKRAFNKDIALARPFTPPPLPQLAAAPSKSATAGSQQPAQRQSGTGGAGDSANAGAAAGGGTTPSK